MYFGVHAKRSEELIRSRGDNSWYPVYKRPSYPVGILDIRLLASVKTGSCHKRQKPQAPTPQAPIRNRQTRKVANAKGLNRNTNLT